MSGIAPRFEKMSLDDFEELLCNKPEDEKWELIDGLLIKSMVGARIEHHRIISNMDFALRDHIRRKDLGCEVFRETFFLKERTDELSALPDIMVHCGQVNPGETSVDDPLILIEVVSRGSEERDRLQKRIAYQKLPSLEQYILVARDQVLVDVYTRDGDVWRGEVALQSRDDILKLPAIEFEMTLAEVYRDVHNSTGTTE